MPRYRRIQIGGDNKETSYQLLISYLRDPPSAASVEEFVFKAPHGVFSLPVDMEEFDLAFDHDQETQLLDVALARLSLHPSKIPRMRELLAWKGKARDKTLYPDPHPGELSALEEAYGEVAALLFLAICPNIRTFKFSTLESPAGVLAEFLRENNYSDPPKYLQNLQHVQLLEHNDNDERFYRREDLFHTIRMFHRLPKFESFYAGAIWPDPDADGLSMIQHGVSNLKQLHLEKCDLASSDIAALIYFSRSLEMLNISLGGRDTEDGASGGIMVPGEIGRALLYHRHSLHTLDMDIDMIESVRASDIERTLERSIYDDGKDDDDALDMYQYDPLAREYKMDQAASTWSTSQDRRDYGSSIGSLRDFSSLKCLGMGIKLLLGIDFPLPAGLVDVLPTSLESLTLRRYRKGEFIEYDDAVEDFMAKKQDLFPHLKVILGVEKTIPNSDVPDGENEDDIEYWKFPTEPDHWEEVTE